MPDDNASVPSAPILTDPVMPVEPAPTLTPAPTTTPAEPFKFQFDIGEEPTSSEPELSAVEPVLPEPVIEQPITTTPPAQPTPPAPRPVPASLPPQKSSAAPVLIILLLLICVVAIASAAFFWMQNQALISQINTVQQTLDHRETPDITPTPTATASATPISTPSAAVTLAPKTDLTAFTNIASIIALAQTNSPTAQLLMITGDHLNDSALVTFKYYFRKSATTKSYIYVQQSAGKAPQLYTQATVTPDNNIPDLSPMLVGGKGGVDSDGAFNLIKNNFLAATVKNLTPTNVSIMYLNTLPPNDPASTTPINLWQFVIKYADNPDVVVQVDANTQKLVFSNR